MKQKSLSFDERKANKENILMIMALLVLIVLSALAVIYSTYKSRQLFSALQQEYRHEVQLEERWGRLLLEQSTWASHVRVEQLAMSELKMKVPQPSSIRVVP